MLSCNVHNTDERTRMIYAAVPAALAEVVALGLFLATLCHLNTARALSRSLQRSDSRRHCSRDTQWYVLKKICVGLCYYDKSDLLVVLWPPINILFAKLIL